MSFWCKHDWEQIDKVVLSTYYGPVGEADTLRGQEVVWLFRCPKCGKFKKIKG